MMRGEIVNALEGARDADSARARLRKWRERRSADGMIANTIFAASVKADLAGQLMVRTEEAKIVKMRVGEPNAFIELSVEDAIDNFKARNLVNPKNVDKIVEQYRKRATKAAELMAEALEQKVDDGLTRAMQEGDTLRDFVRSIREAETTLGVEPASKHYLETVYRTNVQTAYGAGRFRAMTDPDVIAARPYVEYRTVGDGRVRSEHEVLDGQVFRADDDVWHRIAPPNGYNCRCSMVTLDEEDFADSNGKLANKIPEGFQADEGFDGPPVPRL